jgi:hypothetical protein
VSNSTFVQGRPAAVAISSSIDATVNIESLPWPRQIFEKRRWCSVFLAKPYDPADVCALSERLTAA